MTIYIVVNPSSSSRNDGISHIFPSRAETGICWLNKSLGCVHDGLMGCSQDRSASLASFRHEGYGRFAQQSGLKSTVSSCTAAYFSALSHSRKILVEITQSLFMEIFIDMKPSYSYCKTSTLL